ncbi:tetratricopeptide repeat protein [Streptomyces sp. NPDC001222]|uniref:tetratricopeptide repeat protein n=1 Tax=Streptomyces sp. NPDC001222 TaxID=3364548 RepID=UPI00367CF6B0
MKRRTLWAGLAGTVAIAGGIAVWAVQSHPDRPADSKTAPTAQKGPNADTLLAAAKLQAQYDTAGAAGTYRRVLDLDPHNKIAWYNLGVLAQQEGKTADARADYDKALKLDPKYGSALYNEAVLLKSSDPDRAVTLLRRAIAATPKASTAHLQLGQILAKRGRDHEATAEFRRAVAADPSLYSAVPEQFRDYVSPPPTSSQAGDSR